jgi:hypothetical protein
MFGAYLPPVVCRKVHIISMLFVFFCICLSKTSVSYKRGELITLRKHLGSSRLLVWVRVAHLFSFLCVFFSCLVCPVLPVSLGCPFLIAPLVFSNVYFVE